MHLDEERVQRLLHGELTPAGENSARDHMAGCADCRRRFAEARREEGEVYALLRQVDHAAPSVDADVLAARASTRVEEPRAASRWAPRAAGIALALGIAGVAYAVPGSPLPAWVNAVATWIGSSASQSPPAHVRAPDPAVAGIAVPPGRDLLILFTSPQTQGQARVWLTDGADVVVRAPGGAATYTSAADRLVIDNHGSSATFEIRIPGDAPRVEIRMGGKRIFLKEGQSVTTGDSTEMRGPYPLPLTSSGS